MTHTAGNPLLQHSLCPSALLCSPLPAQPSRALGGADAVPAGGMRGCGDAELRDGRRRSPGRKREARGDPGSPAAQEAGAARRESRLPRDGRARPLPAPGSAPPGHGAGRAGKCSGSHRNFGSQWPGEPGTPAGLRIVG